jgi:hypothetical protein
MKLKIGLVAAAIGLLSLIIALGVCFRNSSVKRLPQTIVEAVDVLPHLQDGDVICRLGDRIWSAFIKDISPGDRRFSHVGIVRIRGDSIAVINAECLVSEREERVNEVSLPEFLKVAKAVGVYRANFIDGSVISDNAVQYLGRPFDWKFNADDDTEIYCTELLHIIIKNTAPEYSLETKSVRGFGVTVIPLEAVSNSDDFDEILYITGSSSLLTAVPDGS